MLAPTERTRAEFVALVALTTSLVAMSIDTMLPALGHIATDLALADPNDRQLVLTFFFAGLSIGQLVYGALSDSIGRKPALYAGITLFIGGGLCCALAPSFVVMLAGRTLQGFGAAGPRIVAVATVRDLHSGNAMARVMSFVSTVFILVPIAAPAFGQGVLLIADWRMIFWLLVLVALVDVGWFALRQPETLPLERRVPLSVVRVARAIGEVFRHPISIGYTLAIGCVFSAFISYLTTSQQIFQEQYAVGEWFPVLFGGLAFSLGLASLTNAHLVMRLGMRRLARLAVFTECALATLALVTALVFDGHPPLPLFMLGMVICFFCNGILFGNYNARALEPMGHIAGVAAAITGSLSGLVALAIGTPLGRAYDGTVISVQSGFVIGSFCALTLTEAAEWRERTVRRAAVGDRASASSRVL
jgi:DHA1 family bicyclomycin/chloramphenicol resistance-like MFS transporter